MILLCWVTPLEKWIAFRRVLSRSPCWLHTTLFKIPFWWRSGLHWVCDSYTFVSLWSFFSYHTSIPLVPSLFLFPSSVSVSFLSFSFSIQPPSLRTFLWFTSLVCQEPIILLSIDHCITHSPLSKMIGWAIPMRFTTSARAYLAHLAALFSQWERSKRLTASSRRVWVCISLRWFISRVIWSTSHWCVKKRNRRQPNGLMTKLRTNRGT